MTDECGRHGDSANEVVIWDAGLADGHKSYTHTHIYIHTENNDAETSSLKITLFLLHRHTQVLAACL